MASLIKSQRTRATVVKEFRALFKVGWLVGLLSPAQILESKTVSTLKRPGGTSDGLRGEVKDVGTHRAPY